MMYRIFFRVAILYTIEHHNRKNNFKIFRDIFKKLQLINPTAFFQNLVFFQS